MTEGECRCECNEHSLISVHPEGRYRVLFHRPIHRPRVLVHVLEVVASINDISKGLKRVVISGGEKRGLDFENVTQAFRK